MAIRTNRSIYSRPNTLGGNRDKEYHMRAYTLSNELSRLEYEKKMAEMKIARVERRLEEVQKEIHTINQYFKEQCEFVERDIIPAKPKTKHVTFEY